MTVSAQTTQSTTDVIRMLDLGAQRRRLGGRIDAALSRVVDHGAFIMGPEVAALESRLAFYCGAAHAIACSSGTDALVLSLLAVGVGPGDAVLVPSFTFAASAEAVRLVGAVPVIVDVRDDTFCLDPPSAAAALDALHDSALTPRAVMAVDLFGQPADYGSLEGLCAEHGLVLLADAAQSFGATWQGRRVGSIAHITTTSFFPAKPLGCYGDGGAVFTDDEATAGVLRSLRVHGQGADKYENLRVGLNGRMDTLQAAVLLEKLSIFDDELAARRQIAERYRSELADVVEIPVVADGATSAWAQSRCRPMTATACGRGCTLEGSPPRSTTLCRCTNNPRITTVQWLPTGSPSPKGSPAVSSVSPCILT